MKQTKFRVWDKKRKIMIEEDSIFNLVIYNGDIGCGFHLENEEGTQIEGDFILLQYTGLKDKNGKKIFDGDIVEINVEIQSKNTEEGLFLSKKELSTLKTKREFYNGKWKVGNIGYTFILQSLEDKKIGKNTFHKDTVFGDFKNIMQPEIEIIGNIFKNKDLLK